MRAVLLALVALAFCASHAPAQEPLQADEFVKKAAISNMMAVELGTLALQKSSSPEIKAFAHQAVNDRTTAGTGLRQIVAKRSGIALPERPDQAHQDILRELGNKKGAEFDRAYVTAQKRAQDEAMALFSSYAQTGADAELRTFASKTMPLLQTQGELARKLPGAD